MKFRACRTALIAAAGIGTPLQAQETGDAPPPVAAQAPTVEGGRTYTPADFTRFAPRTALDMLRQVPGFSIQGVSQERGLGQASGNVLINGQRISGKSNDAVTELGRISAASVVRIDIVDAATLNIAGLSGQVANIIVEAAGVSGQFEYRPEFRARNTRPLFTRGSVSVSGEQGPIGYTIGLRNDAGRGGASGPTYIFDPDRDLIDLRDELFRSNVDSPRLSGSFKIDGPGDSIGNINLTAGLFRLRFNEFSDRSGPGQVDRRRRFRQTENEYNYEASGDYEFGLIGGRLKLIALHSFEHSPVVNTSIISFADGSESIGDRFTQTGDETETVGRAEYRWTAGRSDFQLSAEAAFNSLDSVGKLFVLGDGAEFEEVPLPGGTATVSEDRYEVAATYGRTFSPKLSVQLSVGGEYSKLVQTGEFGKARSFYRPKGFVSAAWKPRPGLDVNAKIERRVGQLNFFDFLSSVNLQGGNQNASNPNLVPPQSWDGEVQITKDFGPLGTSTLRVYGRLIEDIVDQIPIGETGEAPGNLDSATVYGFDWKNTVNFGPLGWEGARLDTRLQLQKTRLDDPLTGLSRPISGNLVSSGDFTLRHDIPGSDWAYGVNGSHFKPAKSFRLGQLIYSNEGPLFAGAFVENKDVWGLTMRASIGNALGADSILDRIVYVGRRTGPVSSVERRRRTIGPIFSFLVSGTF